MATETIMQILQWIIPVGGFGTVVGWIIHRDTRKARDAKERNDIYKEMYDNISGTLIELQNENKRLYKAVQRLNQTIQKAVGCPHYAACPMRDELQKSERIDTEPRHRQPGGRKKIRDDPGSRSPEPGGADDTDHEIGPAADRRGL